MGWLQPANEVAREAGAVSREKSAADGQTFPWKNLEP